VTGPVRGPGRRSRSRLHRRAPLLGALLAILVGALPAQAATVAAATAPELQITTAATYDVQPAQARVHVVLDATISNTHRDAGDSRTYFDTAYLAVLPGTSGFAVTSPGVTPTVSVKSATSAYTLLTIGLGKKLFAGKETLLELQFDLPDQGGTGLRDVRVGSTLVAFPVWAFATDATPGSTVTVVFPPGYDVSQQVGDLPDPTNGDGDTQVWQSAPLTDPLSFYSFFVADRPGAFAETRSTASVNGASVPLTIRAWTDDPAWGSRVGTLVKRGLPAIASAVGLPYTGSGLVVQESVSRTIGGYAGLFDPVASTTQVAYYASPFVVLHETAHAWFNGRIASERWILEGFSSLYASKAAATLKMAVDPPVLTPDLRAAAIPLNAWPAVGRADEATEDYAYAATYQLASAIAQRAGDDGLQAVWKAAAAGEAAYQPAHGGPVERAATPPDWRSFLDLLEQHTSASYADLWSTWVVRPTEAHLLIDRASARAAYAGAIAAAGAWDLPQSIRTAMDGWQFDQALALLGDARTALQQRDEVAKAASDAGLTVPPTLKAAFEGANGPTAAIAEAQQELSTIDAIAAADSASRTVSGPLAELGLLGFTPAQEVASAKSAFTTGDLSAAQAHASAAASIWSSAEGRGEQRILSIVAAIVLLLAISGLFAIAIVRTRRARARERDAWD
jgi:hypothetical protein